MLRNSFFSAVLIYVSLRAPAQMAALPVWNQCKEAGSTTRLGGGNPTTFTIPTGCSMLKFRVWGAGGGGGGGGGASGGAGGDGAYVELVVAVPPAVAGNFEAQPGTGGVGGINTSDAGTGGSGGGLTKLSVNGSDRVWAGSGGGGGGADNSVLAGGRGGDAGDAGNPGLSTNSGYTAANSGGLYSTSISMGGRFAPLPSGTPIPSGGGFQNFSQHGGQGGTWGVTPSPPGAPAYGLGGGVGSWGRGGGGGGGSGLAGGGGGAAAPAADISGAGGGGGSSAVSGTIPNMSTSWKIAFPGQPDYISPPLPNFSRGGSGGAAGANGGNGGDAYIDVLVIK